jgi:hypothetical protein
VRRVLEVLYRANSEWRDGPDGAHWCRLGAGCYPMGEEHVVEDIMWRWWRQS